MFLLVLLLVAASFAAAALVELVHFDIFLQKNLSQIDNDVYNI